MLLQVKQGKNNFAEDDEMSRLRNLKTIRYVGLKYRTGYPSIQKFYQQIYSQIYSQIL